MSDASDPSENPVDPSLDPSREDFSYEPWNGAVRLIVVAVMATLLGALAFTVVVYAFNVLLVIFAGVLFGVLLGGLSHRLADAVGLPYKVSLGLVGLTLATLVVGFGFFLGPRLAERSDKLYAQMQQAASRLGIAPNGQGDSPEGQQSPSGAQGESSPQGNGPTKAVQAPDAAGTSDRPEDTREQPTDGQGGGPMGSLGLPDWIGSERLLDVTRQLFTSTLGLLGNLLVVLVVGIYTAVDPSPYRYGLVELFPLHRRQRIREVLDKLDHTLWHWLLGRLFNMTVIGVFTALGLWLIDVPMPVALGVVAGLLTFIPNIGPILAAVPPVLLALSMDTSTVWWVIGLYVGLQTLESYVLTPLVVQHQVSLAPALVISVQIIFGVLGGIVGVAVASPLTAVLMVVVAELYVKDRLGDRQVVSPADR